MSASGDAPPSPPRITHLLELIRLKSASDPVTALTHLGELTAHHPNSVPPPDLLFLLLRRLSASTPTHLPGFLHGFLPGFRRRHLFSESASLLALGSLSRAHMPDAALATFRSLQEIFGRRPGVRAHNALLDAFVRDRRWPQAESLFAYLYNHSFLSPSLETYNILIGGLCSRCQTDRAIELLPPFARQDSSRTGPPTASS